MPRLPPGELPLMLQPIFRALCDEEQERDPAGANAAAVLRRAGLPANRGCNGNFQALLVVATVIERPNPRPFLGKPELRGASGQETLDRNDHSAQSLFYCHAHPWMSVELSKRHDHREPATLLGHLARHYWLVPERHRALELLAAAVSMLIQ